MPCSQMYSPAYCMQRIIPEDTVSTWGQNAASCEKPQRPQIILSNSLGANRKQENRIWAPDRHQKNNKEVPEHVGRKETSTTIPSFSNNSFSFVLFACYANGRRIDDPHAHTLKINTHFQLTHTHNDAGGLGVGAGVGTGVGTLMAGNRLNTKLRKSAVQQSKLRS